METFTFNIETSAGLHEQLGVSPSDFLDRLSDVLGETELPSLRHLALTIDQETGAVTLIFETPAEDWRAAVKAAFGDVGRLFEVTFGADVRFGARISFESEPPIARLEVERSSDREPVPA